MLILRLLGCLAKGSWQKLLVFGKVNPFFSILVLGLGESYSLQQLRIGTLCYCLHIFPRITYNIIIMIWNLFFVVE